MSLLQAGLLTVGVLVIVCVIVSKVLSKSVTYDYYEDKETM